MSRSTPQACTEPTHDQPCGGMVVGTWKLSCYEPFGGVTVTMLPDETYVFDPNGTYTVSVSGAGATYGVSVPSANFAPNSPYGSSCADLGSAATGLGGSCVTNGDDCACSYPTSSLVQMGAYDPQFPDYCVIGNVLSLPIPIGNFATGSTFIKE